MFGKTLSNREREEFMNIAMAGRRDILEGERGRVMYTIKEGKVSKGDLRDLFPHEYEKMKKLKKKDKKLLNIFDKTNYVHRYFFEIHNKKNECQVRPGKIIGFKAERIKDKNQMKAKVEYPDGEVEEKSLEIFPGVEIGDLNLNAYVLVHRNTICQEISEEEYKEIMDRYY